MVEPLRKQGKDGNPYERRSTVENELQEFEKLNLPDALARARHGERRAMDSVSSEALVYILRREARTGTRGPGVDGLVSLLVKRSERILRRHISGAFDELQTDEICREVVDRMIDDICDQGDRADYAEVNFNDWLAHNRIDACRKQSRKAARRARFGDTVEDLAEDEVQIVPGGRIEDQASPEPTPEAAYALREAREKAPLPPQIARDGFSPEDRYRIATMVRRAKLGPNVLEAFLLHHYWGMAIESKNPDKHTLVKHFGKSEKTIRLWLGRAAEAFAKLRGEINEHEADPSGELGLGATRLPR